MLWSYQMYNWMTWELTAKPNVCFPFYKRKGMVNYTLSFKSFSKFNIVKDFFFYSYNNSKIIKLHVVWNILLYHHLYTIIRYYELHGRRNWRWFTQMTSAARAHINTRSHQWVHRCEWPTLRDKMDTFISLSWMSLSWKHRLRVVYRVNMNFCNSLKVYSQLLNFYYGSCHIGAITFTIRATSIKRCPMTEVWGE